MWKYSGTLFSSKWTISLQIINLVNMIHAIPIIASNVDEIGETISSELYLHLPT
jgi:hypothetical protein